MNIHTPPATPNLTAALDFAAAGVAVFPAGPDKRPLLAGWQKKASIEAEQSTNGGSSTRTHCRPSPSGALVSSSSTAIGTLAAMTASKPSTGL